MNFSAVSPNTFNRATQAIADKKSMLDSAKHYTISDQKLVLLVIADFFTFGKASETYFEWYEFHSNEKEVVVSWVFAYVAGIDLTNDQDTFIEYQSDHGLVRFEEKIILNERRILARVGDDPKNAILLEGVSTLKELQDCVRADIRNNLFAYIELNAPIKFSGLIEPDDDIRKNLSSLTEAPIGIEPQNIVSEEAVEDSNLSTVTKITYKNGDVYFFKPIASAPTSVTAHIISGIPIGDNRYAQRSILTYVLSEVLGLHVVPKTCLANNKKGQPGYIQKNASGMVAHKCLKNLYENNKLASLENIELFEQVIKIQLLDALTAQVDRHWGNYFIDMNNNTATCIDNDGSFGYLVTHPHNMIGTYRNDGYLPHKLTATERKTVAHLKSQRVPLPNERLKRNASFGMSVFLPPVMDKSMIHTFKNLSEISLIKYMLEFEFNDDEITATCLRLKAIKYHIVEVLEKRHALGVHSVIEKNEWGSKKTADRLFPTLARYNLLSKEAKKVYELDDNPGNALKAFSFYLQRDTLKTFKAALGITEGLKIQPWVQKAHEEGIHLYPELADNGETTCSSGCTTFKSPHCGNPQSHSPFLSEKIASL